MFLLFFVGRDSSLQVTIIALRVSSHLAPLGVPHFIEARSLSLASSPVRDTLIVARIMIFRPVLTSSVSFDCSSISPWLLLPSCHASGLLENQVHPFALLFLCYHKGFEVSPTSFLVEPGESLATSLRMFAVPYR